MAEVVEKAHLLQHVIHIVADRLQAARVRKAADTAVRQRDGQLMTALREMDKGRLQLPDGTLLQIVPGQTRTKIVAEKLLRLGVAPEVIKAATEESERTADYIKIDPPKGPAEAATPGVATPYGELPAGNSTPAPSDDEHEPPTIQ